MWLRYNYRLYPAPGQQIALARAFGCARVVYNDALAAREAAHEAGEPYPTDAQLSARLTAAKKAPERAWLIEVSAVVLQQALADLNTAYRNFFAALKGERKGPKVGRPRFRSRKDHRQAIRFTVNARFKILPGGKLRLPKIGDVPVRWSRPLPSEPSSVTVIRDSAGRYFASFVVLAAPYALPGVEPVVGIDLGLTHFAVLSNGRKIPSPQFLRRAEKRLKRRQRDLSRKQIGSANRNKARVKVARAHARVADARRDFHHQLSTALIRDNQAVAVEDLAVKGLARTRLAKSIHDAGWSGFVAMLEYKARLYGREFHRIGRFTPTSQTCSACGAKDGPKPLHVREWQCRACGAHLDRDINAAVNVAKAAGLAVTACGAQVRPGASPLAQRSEAGTTRPHTRMRRDRRESPPLRAEWKSRRLGDLAQGWRRSDLPDAAAAARRLTAANDHGRPALARRPMGFLRRDGHHCQGRHHREAGLPVRKGVPMAQPVVHFEIIGRDPARLRGYFGELFGWEFDTSSPVAEAVSEPANYGFVNRVTTSDGTGIPGGVGGGPGYDSHVLFYIGVPDVEAALRRAETLGGKRRMGLERAPTGPW